MNNIIPLLVESVKSQVQDSQIIKELTEKLEQKKYRQAFLIFNNLKESGKWVLNESDEKHLEEFWWEYAN
ncbi:MAG: hypothetical protein ACOYYF_03535 [Chloroflexota bacterium]|nr:hypothetical protein [Chloroflexota bacterium]MBI5703747.1 hypothetical protein [Chloroflexota bacterium]